MSVFPRCEYSNFDGQSGCESAGGHYNPIAGVTTLDSVCWRAMNDSYDYCFPPNLCPTVKVRKRQRDQSLIEIYRSKIPVILRVYSPTSV